MFGLIIGVPSGVLQYYLLLKFTSAVSSGKVGTKAVIFALTQFLLPLVVLVISAFFLGESILGENFLMWIGIGMAASLIICAVAKYLIVNKALKEKK